MDRNVFYYRLLLRQIHIAFFQYQRGVKHFGQTVHSACTKYYFDKGESVVQLFGDFLLLHHTAAYGDDKRFVFGAAALQRAYIAEYTFFCVVAHAACIE